MPRDKIESTPKDDPLNDYLNEDRVSRDKSGIRDLLPPKQEPEAETSEYSLRNSSSRKSKSLREKLLSNNPALETDPKKQVNFTQFGLPLSSGYLSDIGYAESLLRWTVGAYHVRYAFTPYAFNRLILHR